MVDAELVLPIGVGDPDGDQVGLVHRDLTDVQGQFLHQEDFGRRVRLFLARPLGSVDAAEAGEGDRGALGAQRHIQQIFDAIGGLEVRRSRIGGEGRVRPGRERAEVVFLLIVQAGDTEGRTKRQVEVEAQSCDDVSFGRRDVVVLGVCVGAPGERDVGERARAEVEPKELLPAQGAAEEAVDFGGALAAGALEAGQPARGGRIAQVRFQQVDVEEVGAVGPRIEVRDTDHLLVGLADIRVGGIPDIRVAHGGLVHEPERRGRRRWRLDRHVGCECDRPHRGDRQTQCGTDISVCTVVERHDTSPFQPQLLDPPLPCPVRSQDPRAARRVPLAPTGPDTDDVGGFQQSSPDCALCCRK